MTIRSPRLAAVSYAPPPPPHTRRITGSYARLLALAGCAGLGVWTSTQYVAWRLAFHPSLGSPWLHVGAGTAVYLQAGAVCLAGTGLALLFLRLARFVPAAALAAAVLGALARPGALYDPIMFVRWGIAYGGFRDDAPLQAVFSEGLVAGGTAFALAVLIVVLAFRSRRRLAPTGSAGTADWDDGQSLASSGGLILGRGQGRARRTARREGNLLRYRGEGHLLTVAPTRSGKGTGGVIPNLLTYPGSIVVTDPKGENFAVTARRRRELGTDALALDPFGQLGRLMGASLDAACVASYNPMDLIDPHGEDALECASLLADMLVLTPEGKGGEESFWNEEAKGLLAGLILYVAAHELDEELRPTPERTLGHVRELLTLERDHFAELLETMQRSFLAGGLVRRAANRLLQKEEKERSGVVSTAQSHTHFLDSPHMQRALSASTFEMNELRAGTLSLYLVLPAHYLDTYSRWLRLVIASALHELSRLGGAAPTANTGAERVLFLLDEFANLGRMNPVLRAVSLMAGYGVSIWLFLQDLSQLKGTYPNRWGTFFANADVFQAFGTTDYDTAKYLSDLAGEMTVLVETAGESESRSRSRHVSRGQGATRSFAERGRKLLFPDEVRRMAPREQVLFVRGMAPVRAEKVVYFRDSEFAPGGKPLFDPNPTLAAPLS